MTPGKAKGQLRWGRPDRQHASKQAKNGHLRRSTNESTPTGVQAQGGPRLSWANNPFATRFIILSPHWNHFFIGLHVIKRHRKTGKLNRFSRCGMRGRFWQSNKHKKFCLQHSSSQKSHVWQSHQSPSSSPGKVAQFSWATPRRPIVVWQAIYAQPRQPSLHYTYPNLAVTPKRVRYGTQTSAHRYIACYVFHFPHPFVKK